MDFDKKLCQKIVSALSDRERQFGDVNFSDEEKALLKQYYITIMSQGFFNESLNCEIQEIVTAFLICTTKNYKGDWDGKSFWDRIRPEIIYRPDYQVQLPSIGKCLERYERPSFRTVSRTVGDHRYAESLFFQAYSPRVSVNAFIELAWSFYCDSTLFEMNYFDTEEEQRLCRAIIDDLDKFYSNSDIDSGLTIESQSYSIRSGLRYAFKEDPEAATKILRRILRYIDFIYHHSDSVSDDEGYLGSLCNQYVPKLLATLYHPDNGERLQRQKVTVDDIQKVKALYSFDERELGVYLTLPRIRLYKDDQQYKMAEVKLFLHINGEDNLVFQHSYPTVGEHYKHLLDEIFIPLGDYLQFCTSDFSFRVTLSFDGMDPVYDSKESLYRKYVVFKAGKEIFSKIVQPGEFVILHPSDFRPSSNVHSSQSPVVFSESLFDVSMNDGDRISYCGTYYFFGDKQTGAHFLYDEAKTLRAAGVTFQYSDITYDICKAVGPLILRCDQQIQADHLVLQIFDNTSTLKTSVPVSDFPSDSDVYSIDLAKYLKRASDPLGSLYTVVVIDASQKQTLFCDHLAIFPDFSIQRGASPYLQGKSEMSLSVFGQVFSAVGNKNDTVCDISAFNGTISVSTPYFSWRVNEGEIHWEPIDSERPILKRAFQSNDLLTVDSFFSDVSVFCGQSLIKKDPKSGKFLLGNYLFGPLGVAAFEQNLTVYAKLSGVVYPLFALTNSAYLRNKNSDSVFTINGNSVSISLVDNFVGDSKTQFTFELTPDDGDPISFQGNFAESVFASPALPTGSYSYNLSYSDTALRVVLLSGDLYVGDPNSLLYQGVEKIKINKISRVKMSDVYLTNIEYQGDDGFGPVYLCRVHAPWFKTIQGEMVAGAGNNLSSIRYLGKDGLFHDFSVDVNGKKLSFEKADDTKYLECLSIFSKGE
jgi:hypothetical protein